MVDSNGLKPLVLCASRGQWRLINMLPWQYCVEKARAKCTLQKYEASSWPVARGPALT